MGYCPNCGKEVRDGARFCVFCGQRLAGERSTGMSQLPQPPGSPRIEETHLTSSSPAEPVPGQPPTYPGGDERRRGEKKSPLLVAVILGVISLAAGALVMFLVLRNRGLSVEDYKNKVGGVHRQVRGECESLLHFLETGEAWPSLEEYFSSQGMETQSAEELVTGISTSVDEIAAAKTKIDDLQGVLKKSVDELKGVRPPEKARSLHEGLLSLYKEGIGITDEMLVAATFLQETLSAYVENRSFFEAAEELGSLDSLEEITPEEITEKMREIVRLLDNLIGRLETITPPGDLMSFHQGHLVCWKEVRGAFVDLLEALSRLDKKRMEMAERKIESYEAKWEDLGHELERFFSAVDDRFRDYRQRIEEAGGRIDAL